jgi:hypothetical protein
MCQPYIALTVKLTKPYCLTFEKKYIFPITVGRQREGEEKTATAISNLTFKKK